MSINVSRSNFSNKPTALFSSNGLYSNNSSSAWQSLLEKVEPFISAIEASLEQKSANEYNSRTALIGLTTDLYNKVNDLMKMTDDVIDLNLPENRNVIKFIEEQRTDIIGVYEDGVWILPENLPQDDNHPVEGTRWVNLEQLNAIGTEFENFISLCSDSTPLEVLQKQALFQQLSQQYSFMVQLISQRNELLKTIIQAIR